MLKDRDLADHGAAKVWAPQRIDLRSVTSLVPHARNARTHSPSQISLIAGSIRESGFTNPVLLDGENGIIAGHGRVLAAQQLGIEAVPAIELSHLSETQKRAYLLADNKLAEAAGWDRELLALEIGDLADLGVDLEALGFDARELDQLFCSVAADPSEDQVPEVQPTAVSQPGDLWILGGHRLLCGDATQSHDTERLFAGVKPQQKLNEAGV